MKNIKQLRKEIEIESKLNEQGLPNEDEYRLAIQLKTLKDVLKLIKEEEWLENDERHTESFRDGIKLAHTILRKKIIGEEG